MSPLFSSSASLLLGILCVGRSAVAQQDGPILKIETPQQEVLPNTPLFVNLSGRVKVTGELEFSVLLDDKRLEGCNPEKIGQARVHRHKDPALTVDSVSARWSFHFSAAQDKCFLAEPGEYKIKIREEGSGLLSNELRIVVKKPEGEDAGISKAFGQKEVLLAMYSDEEVKVGDDRLEQIARNHSDTALGPYAAFFRLKKRYKALTRKSAPSQDEQITRLFQIAELAKEYTAAEKIPGPSPWHAEALICLSHARALGGSYEKCLTDLAQLKITYPEGAIFDKASKLYAEVAELARRKRR